MLIILDKCIVYIMYLVAISGEIEFRSTGKKTLIE